MDVTSTGGEEMRAKLCWETLLASCDLGEREGDDRIMLR
jgi:hypothetical protein